MSDKPLNIVRPVFPTVAEFAADLDAALASGQVTNQSRWVQEFERQLAVYLGVRYCAVIVNGETALLLMLKALGLRGSVLVPSYTFSGTVHALVWTGLTPVFVDIDRETLTMDPRDAASKITPDVVGIMPVSLYGNPCDIPALQRLADERHLTLCFDSAPGFGAAYRGTKLGNFGVAESFSFHATKVFSTCEGGALTTNNETLYRQVCALRNFGQDAECDCSEAGLNGKMTEVCALIGLRNLRKLDQQIGHRQVLVDRFFRNLAGIPGLAGQKRFPDCRSTQAYLFVRIDPSAFGRTRDDLIRLLGQANITARRFFCNPVHKMRCYQPYGHLSLPVTESVSQTGLSLPLYSDMSTDELDRISEVFTRAQRR